MSSAPPTDISAQAKSKKNHLGKYRKSYPTKCADYLYQSMSLSLKSVIEAKVEVQQNQQLVPCTSKMSPRKLELSILEELNTSQVAPQVDDELLHRLKENRSDGATSKESSILVTQIDSLLEEAQEMQKVLEMLQRKKESDLYQKMKRQA